MKRWDEIPAWQAALRLVGITLAFFLALALLIWQYSCGCPRIARPSATHYAVDKGTCQRTLMGACVLLNSNIVDEYYFGLIDDLINDTEVCLKEWQENKSDILHRVPNWKPPARSCYTVYVVDDWTTSCDGEWQVFGSAPQESCNAKGFKEDPNCPCKYRGLLQDGKVIIVPPDLKFLRIEVIEWLTGYRSVDLWATPELVKCGGY